MLRKQVELERSYEALKLIEQQRTLSDERERIQRDMHDGIGGTLVSTLAGLDLEGAGESSAAQSLRGALDDLRLMIYSLEPGAATLRTALASLGERLRRQGEEVGLVVEWRAGELAPEFALERGDTLQVMRILQEAFANAVKHARANTFCVSARTQAAQDGRAGVIVEIRDDGVGIDPARVTGGGHGLTNMRVRAQKLRGTLLIEPATPGTRLTLWVPA